jgi:cytochrome c553
MLKSIGYLGAAVLCMAWSQGAMTADLAAGKAKVDAICSECHEAADWEGEDAASLEELIQGVASGAVKHKVKLNLTGDDIKNIAAYWASSG